VERLVRAWRRVDDATAAAEAESRRLQRQLSTWTDDDGMVVIRGRLTPELGAVVQRALEAAGELSGTLEVDHGAVNVSAETSRRLSCDASLVPIRHGADGTPLDIGRKTRTVPPSIRRALLVRDRTCRFPGCPPGLGGELPTWDGTPFDLVYAVDVLYAPRAPEQDDDGGFKAEWPRTGSSSRSRSR
jgi:hypothetical protein